MGAGAWSALPGGCTAFLGWVDLGSWRLPWSRAGYPCIIGAEGGLPLELGLMRGRAKVSNDALERQTEVSSLVAERGNGGDFEKCLAVRWLARIAPAWKASATAGEARLQSKSLEFEV